MERIRLEMKRKIEGKLVHETGRICPVLVLLEFQKFVGYWTVKLVDICCVLCVEIFYQKSIELVEQNLNFRNVKKPGNEFRMSE